MHDLETTDQIARHENAGKVTDQLAMRENAKYENARSEIARPENNGPDSFLRNLVCNIL